MLKFFIKLIFTVSIFISSFSILQAEQTEPSSGEYQTDKTNRLISRPFMPALAPALVYDFFACQGKNGSENHPNANWKTLGDTNACMIKSGLKRADPNGETVSYQPTIYSSSRATATSDQVLKAWGINEDGNYLLARHTLSGAPTAENPNGELKTIYDVIEPTSSTTHGDAKGKFDVGVNSSGNSTIKFALSNNYKIPGLDNYHNSVNPVTHMVYKMNAELNKDSSGVSALKTAKGQSLGCDTYGIGDGMGMATGGVTGALANFSCGPAASSTKLSSNTTVGTDLIFQFNMDGDFAHIKTLQANASNPISSPATITTKCYDFGNSIEIAHGYDLYNISTGAKYEFNGPFAFTRSLPADDMQGYMSYWGAWLQDDYLDTGDKIKKSDGTEYDIVATRGRMIKQGTATENFTTVSQGTSSPYWKWFFSGGVWSELNFKFGGASNKARYVAATTLVDASGTTLVTAGTDLGEAFNGDNFYNKDTYRYFNIKTIPTVSGSTITANGSYVTFTYTDINMANYSSATGGSVDLDLFCYGTCPKPEATAGGGLTTAGFSAATFTSKNSYPYVDAGGTAIEYVLEADDLQLYLKDSSCTSSRCKVSPNYEVTSGSPNAWWSYGPTFVTSAKSSWGDIYSGSQFYWHMSDSHYQDTIIAKDSGGAAVTIDQPVQFNYTHSNANDRNWSSGDADVSSKDKKFWLEYAGDSNLWGIPWTENTTSKLWEPNFTLKDGTELDTDGNSATGNSRGADYVVLAKRLEKNLPEAASASSCSSLSLDNIATDYPLPDLPTSSELSAAGINVVGEIKGGEETSLTLISTEPCYVDGIATGASGCS